jgi:hypothetical protein
MTFRLFLFADRDANRVTRLEQIPGEARQERISCSSLEVPGLEIRCRYLEDHPGTNYVAPDYTVNPLGLEFLEKLFHTVLIVLKE